jgi:hypothetical protein
VKPGLNDRLRFIVETDNDIAKLCAEPVVGFHDFKILKTARTAHVAAIEHAPRKQANV